MSSIEVKLAVILQAWCMNFGFYPVLNSLYGECGHTDMIACMIKKLESSGYPGVKAFPYFLHYESLSQIGFFLVFLSYCRTYYCVYLNRYFTSLHLYTPGNMDRLLWIEAVGKTYSIVQVSSRWGRKGCGVIVSFRRGNFCWDHNKIDKGFRGWSGCFVPEEAWVAHRKQIKIQESGGTNSAASWEWQCGALKTWKKPNAGGHWNTDLQPNKDWISI